MLAQALAARGRRVVCPDLPGRGASDWLPDPALYAVPTYVAALAHLLARFDEGQVDWVGTSLGGLCALAIAATPGQPIRRQVLNDIGPFVPGAALARIRDYLTLSVPSFAEIAELEAHLRQIHAPFGPLTDAQWRHLAETGARHLPDGRIALHYDPAIAAPFGSPEAVKPIDLWHLWEVAQVPTLVLRGAMSDLLLPETAARMADRAGVEIAEIAGTGHAPALMEPRQIDLILEFLNRA